MKVGLSFAAFFSSIIGTDRVEIEAAEGSTIEEVLKKLFDENPEYYNKLHRKKLFLLGDFRAIYHINRSAVKKDHVLSDGDELKVLKAFIGG